MILIHKNKQKYHRFHLLHLSEDLILSILTFCKPFQVVKMSQTCHLLYHLTCDMSTAPANYLWKQLCIQYYMSCLSLSSTFTSTLTKNDEENEGYANDYEENDGANGGEKQNHENHENGHVMNEIEAELSAEKQKKSQKGNQQSFELESGVANWKDQFQMLSSYVWDVKCAEKCRHLLYSNHNRSVENPKDIKSSYWATTRTLQALRPGHSYAWCVSLDKFERATHNTWWIIVGVESPQFRFDNQLGNDVIGYQSEHVGAGLIIGNVKGAHAGERVDCVTSGVVLKAGDVIRIEFDMTLSSEDADKQLNQMCQTSGVHTVMTRKHELGARIMFHLIRDDEAQPVPLVTINNIRGQLFYPTVSMNQEMAVTIKPIYL